MRALGFIAVAAVVAAAGLDLNVALRPSLEEVSAADMTKAHAQIVQRKQRGDIVVHSPLFTMRELAPLQGLSARPDLPKPGLMATRRVVLLDRVDVPMHGFEEPTESFPIGDLLVLSVFEPAGDVDVPLFSLYDDLSPRSMLIERPAGTVSSRCTRKRGEGGFSCPGEAEWLYAAQASFRIDSQDRPCVWAHPTTGGVVLFEIPPQPAAPAGRRLQLRVGGGMTDEAIRTTPGGATVTTEIKQGGKTLGRVIVANKVGWVESRLRISPDLPVELRITTPKDGRRHHCINADVTEKGNE